MQYLGVGVGLPSGVSFGVFHGGIAHGFEHQCVCARRHPQVVNAFFVGACACGSAFDLYGGEVHDFMVRGDDFS